MNDKTEVNPKLLTTSTRKRPNKTKLLNQAKLRGHQTHCEMLMLTGLSVKNLLQRINNKCFDDVIKNADCKKIEELMKVFVASCDEILENK